jgi:mutual gliding-motility protein MglA
MVFFNYATMEMSAKIVYYGPGLCGKTTNLQQIYNITNPTTRGEMVSLATETDRTLFFDLLPINLGNIGGFKTRFQLYTVPGQVFYNSTRKLVLKGVDAVVFVADSQEPMLEANIESLENLEENLAELNLSLSEIPWVMQYNKRDLPNIMSVAELEEHLNKTGVPYFEAVAITGKGVLETLKGISKLTLLSLKKKTGEIEEDEFEEEEVEEAGDVDFDVDEFDDDEDFEEIDDDYNESDDAEAGEHDDDYAAEDDENEEVFEGEEEYEDYEDYGEEADEGDILEVVKKVVIPVDLEPGQSLEDLNIQVRFDVQFKINRR